ncbi:MAG: hypothetical protein P4L53_07010 [Candidatus Obscuribacterales bacterium]|nr:hypothetical protein [Candidatus Obscuribacterales bacterium]
MNKLLSVVFVAISFALPGLSLADEHDFRFPKAGDYPMVRNEASIATDFVPSGWKVLAKASGDLNGDKLGDVALVIQGNFSKYKQKSSDLVTGIFDTNPRMLLILLNNPGGKGFRLAKVTRNIVGCADVPTMSEPLQKIAIKNGVLEVHVESFYSAGGWSASNTVYKFQLRDDKFVLIGAERKETQRNTGEETSYSYNFLIGKLKLEKGIVESDAKKDISWKKIPKGHLRDIDQFKTLYEWQVIPDCYL